MIQFRYVTTSENLFVVAARELGDATQAWRIASINGLSDFNLSALTTLRIPSVNAALTGGVPVQ